MDQIILTDNSKRALTFMQEHDEVLIGKDMLDALGMKSYAPLSSLVKHGLIEHAEPISRPFTNIKGETKDKEYKTYRLTDAGRAFQL